MLLRCLTPFCGGKSRFNSVSSTNCHIMKLLCVAMVLVVLGLSYHFKADVFPCLCTWRILETKVSSVESKSWKRERVIFSVSPQIDCNIMRLMQENFWRCASIDTLKKYSQYTVVYYRESRTLTFDFKEGNTYKSPSLLAGDEMDWRNHIEEKLGDISIERQDDGSWNYYVTIRKSRYGFRWLQGRIDESSYMKSYSSIHALPFGRIEKHLHKVESGWHYE